MKLIAAVIRPFKLDEVKNALAEIGVDRMTVLEVKRYPPPSAEGAPRHTPGPQFIPKLRIELAVHDGVVAIAIDAITAAAFTDKAGEISVQNLLDVVRIRTEEHGEDAV